LVGQLAWLGGVAAAARLLCPLEPLSAPRFLLLALFLLLFVPLTVLLGLFDSLSARRPAEAAPAPFPA
jgi:hypothetical protein